MKKLTIFTERYFKELDDSTVCFIKRAKKSNTQAITIYFEAFDSEALYVEALHRLLEWVCFQENPILRNTPKLAALLREATVPAMREKNKQALTAYITENSTLHIEGYARFRMAAYTDYLNGLLYRIAKKLKI
jgi:hypothetical protein